MLVSKKKKIVIILIVAVLSFALAIVGGYVFLSLQKDGDSSDISIIEAESAGEEKSDADASFEYSGSVTLNTDKDNVSLNFTNPFRSRKSLSLEIVAEVDGETITLAKVKKLPPGKKVIRAKNISGQEIARGDYDGKFIIHFYDEFGKEEIVNSEIKIKVYVR